MKPRAPATSSALARPEVAVVEPEVVRRELRGLLLSDFSELGAAAGFGRLVRMLVSAPLVLIGVLTAAAGFAAGQGFLGLLGTVMTALIVGALRDDTRINAALELLERGELRGAEAGMRNVANSNDRQFQQRQRARMYLVAIAWARADHREALQWIQDRNRGMLTQVGVPLDERFASLSTEVQLLALLGRGEEAHTLLSRLPPCPADTSLEHMAARSELLVAFALDDPERVFAKLDGWERRWARADRLGMMGALLGWAWNTLGQRERATYLMMAVRREGDLEFLERHCPRLRRVVDAFDDTVRRYG